MCNNLKLDHVNINAHTKFGLFLYKSSEDIERGRIIMTDEQTDRRKNEQNDRQPKFYIAPLFQSGALKSKDSRTFSRKSREM